MSANSAIEWTDATWNPIRARAWEIQDDGSGKERVGWHCEHVSEGCRNCYAERINLRLGTGFEFKPGVLRGKAGYHGGGIENPELFLDEKMLTLPLRWRKSKKIFVCSMSDLFADFVPDQWIDKMFAVMALCPQHTFQILTKRAERMLNWSRRNSTGGHIFHVSDNLVRGFHPQCTHVMRPSESPGRWPLPNVMLGVSCERQEEADARIPLLLQTPAAVRFISAEPLLGPIDLHDRCTRDWHPTMPPETTSRLDWIIAGGESGSHARPMHPQWARDLRDQCQAAGVPFFYKQSGEFASVSEVEGPGTHFSFPDGSTVRRVGKKAAGRLLAGREWNEFPAVVP